MKRALETEEDEEQFSEVHAARVRCPFLDTVTRSVLDFDMTPSCSVSLAPLNVYCCLVCGKFFQGRGKTTPCYTHSLQAGHFVFMNLHDTRVYCLPDGYEVLDSSLDDIKRCLQPVFTHEEIMALSRDNTTLARDVHGVSYLPGFVGLNNLNQTDYVNTVLHALAHIVPIRDFFLNPINYTDSKSSKLWSRHNFKSVVSPQELVHEISVSSQRRFTIGKKSECIDLFVWLLTELNKGIVGSRKQPSVLLSTVQGRLEVTTHTRVEGTSDEWVETSAIVPFSYLGLDIPPSPLFKDSQGGMVIAQVPLFELLRKYDGKTWTDSIVAGNVVRKKYRVLSLPDYLVLHLNRFTKNNFYEEKNPTIVTFPVKNLELKDYLVQSEGIPPLSLATTAKDLLAVVREFGTAVEKRLAVNIVEKEALLELATRIQMQQLGSKYDLVANICHDSTASSGISEITSEITSGDKKRSATTARGRGGGGMQLSALERGSYRVHLLNQATGQWFEIQDLHVAETLPQLIGLSESTMLVYQRKR